MCPVCGGEVVDIIYGTGDMQGYQFVLQYRRSGIMGGDIIPKDPPIWACACGCKRFRKVNWDGSVAEVKPKLLKNLRKYPISLMQFESSSISQLLQLHDPSLIHHYKVSIETEFGEKETLHITAADYIDAKVTADELVASENLGFKGCECVSIEAVEEEK
jgi:hypothetical protein